MLKRPVVDPNGVPEARDPFHPLSVSRNMVESRLGKSCETFEIETPMLELQGLRVEQKGGPHVHRGGFALDIEEGRIQGTESFTKWLGHHAFLPSKICAQPDLSSSPRVQPPNGADDSLHPWVNARIACETRGRGPGTEHASLSWKGGDDP